MKTRVLIIAAGLSVALAGAEPSNGGNLPPEVAQQLGDVVVNEVGYNRALLYDVCEQLHTFLVESGSGPATNLCLEVAQSAAVSAEPTRITFSERNVSVWKVLSFVRQKTRIDVEYTNRCVVVRTYNEGDHGYGSVWPRLPPEPPKVIVISDPASNVVIGAYLEAQVMTGKEMASVNGDQPLSFILTFRPRFSQSEIEQEERQYSLEHKVPKRRWEPVGQVSFRKDSGGGVTLSLEKNDGGVWSQARFEPGRWLVTHDSESFGPNTRTSMYITHLRDPQIRLPAGEYKLTFTCRLRSDKEGKTHDFDLEHRISFKILDAKSTDKVLAGAWTHAYTKTVQKDVFINQDERETINGHLSDISGRFPCGKDVMIDLCLGNIYSAQGEEEKAFDRYVEFAKKGLSDELSSKPFFKRLRLLSERLHREDPEPAIMRYRQEKQRIMQKRQNETRAAD